MENKIQFTAKAKKDLEESVNFYEDKKVGLGKDFLNTIKEKSLEIKSQPEKNPSSEDGVKKTKVKKFPFYIYDSTAKTLQRVFLWGCHPTSPAFVN
ncbi:MAG: hypothetical protein SFU98_17450 [Leptospiraceae bacterium]|nr:hypothetical protein [Leptospiraceae bacterium]